MLYDYEFQAIVNWSYFAAIAKSRRAHTLITGFSSHLEFDLNTYQVDWLSQIETQRANKFYRKFHFRGKAKSDDLCAVVKDPNKEIIASGIYSSLSSFRITNSRRCGPPLTKKGDRKQTVENPIDPIYQQYVYFPILKFNSLL